MTSCNSRFTECGDGLGVFEDDLPKMSWADSRIIFNAR